MTPSPAIVASRETGLPQLSARLVLIYRGVWCLLAIVGAAVLASSMDQAGADPTVLAIRLVKAVVLIGVCTILLRRRPADPVAGLLSLAFLTWAISSSVDFSSVEVLPQLLDRLRFLLFALALLLFPDGQWKPRGTRFVAGGSTAVFVLGVGETLGLFPTRLFLPLAIGCVVMAIAALIDRFRTAESDAVRQQLKWISLGLVAGVGLILTARAGAALTPTSPSSSSIAVGWEALFQLGIVTVALGFLVSLLRYRLFDAEAAISRSAALAGLTVAMVATFAGTEATIEWVGQQYLGMGIGDVSAAMAAAVAAVLLNPLHTRISDWAECRFQRDLVLLRKELPELLADLAANATPRELADAILPRINEAVSATGSALIVGVKVISTCGIGRSRARLWSRDFAEDSIFRMRIDLGCPFSGRPAWLLLGPRPDGTLYGRDELEALGAIRTPIRQALSWALYRERMQIAGRRQLALVRAELARLNKRMDELSVG